MKLTACNWYIIHTVNKLSSECTVTLIPSHNLKLICEGRKNYNSITQFEHYENENVIIYLYTNIYYSNIDPNAIYLRLH